MRMASNQETLLLGCRSVFTEDSFLLSDYLHRQVERAGNRLFNNKNSLLFLRSKIFSSEFKQEEGEKVLSRCCPQRIESITVGVTSTLKESSESLWGKECSSNVLSDLKQPKGASFSSERSLASSTSCIESSPGSESEFGFTATARAVITKGERVHNDVLCCEPKEEIYTSNCGTELKKGAADELPATEYDTEALDLLVLVAMQATGCNARHDASLNPSQGAHINGDCGASRAYKDIFKPISRKRVIRRAKSAFQKQLLDESLEHKFKFCESSRKKETGCGSNDQRIEPPRHAIRLAHAKQKKLQDLAFSSPDDPIKACMVKDFKGSFLVNGEDTPKISVQTVEDRLNVVNYRKLQIASSTLFDEYDAELQEARKPKWAAPIIVPSNNQLSFQDSKGELKPCTDNDRNKNASIEKLNEGNSAVMPADDVKQVNSCLRLKILPVRQPSEDLTSKCHGFKEKNSESVTEDGRMVTRKRSTQQRLEKEKAYSPITALSAFRQQTVTQTGASDSTDPVMRTKRGRSQVLPTKFSDSVLQPWKSSSRKIRILDA